MKFGDRIFYLSKPEGVGNRDRDAPPEEVRGSHPPISLQLLMVHTGSG